MLIKPVSMIRRSIDVMSRLISGLRDLASIETGHLSIETRSEDALALVGDAIEGGKTSPPRNCLSSRCGRPREI